MSDLKSYNAGEVSIIVGTRALSGLAEGTFVNIVRDEDAFTKQVGADGEVTRSKTNNKSGSIEITTQQGSDANDYLSGVHASDENSGSGVVPVTVIDKSGSTVAFSRESWVRKIADAGFGRDAGERTWILDCAQLEVTVGGN